MIIALEGIDNSGKTTIAKRLERDLVSKDYNVIISKELTSDVGKLLINKLKNKNVSSICKAYLFAADRQLRLEELGFEMVLPAACNQNGLSNTHRISEDCKTIYIFDRYVYSAIAYRESEGLDASWVEELNRFAPNADLNVYIDITPEESIERNSDKKFNIKYTLKQLELVRDCYLRYVKSGSMLYVDGMRNEDDVYEDVKTRILDLVLSKMISKESYDEI